MPFEERTFFNSAKSAHSLMASAVSGSVKSKSSIKALETKLDVIANNLANVNTEGFKSSRANFQDLLYEEKSQPGMEMSFGAQGQVKLPGLPQTDLPADGPAAPQVKFKLPSHETRSRRMLSIGVETPEQRL